MEQEKANAILQLLYKSYPEARTSLDYGTPLDLLVATILSAQCTDKRVNIVTKELFKKYKTAQDYAKAKQEIFEKEIKSTGFYKNKAKNILGAARMLVKDYGGKVPTTMDELLKLPGIGRKTANVIISNVTGKHAGVVVDTHVTRLSQRIGFSKHTDPVKIEQDLIKLFNQKDWMFLSNALVFHGRAVCTARKAMCENCPINKLCKSAFKV